MNVGYTAASHAAIAAAVLPAAERAIAAINRTATTPRQDWTTLIDEGVSVAAPSTPSSARNAG